MRRRKQLPRQRESLFRTPQQQAKYEASKKEIHASLQQILDELDDSTRLTAEDYSIVINAR